MWPCNWPALQRRSATMSRNAADACRKTGIAYVRLERPVWAPTPVDNWQQVETVTAAAAVLSPGARAFVTIGRQDIGAFFERSDTYILARMIEPPAAAPPPHVEILLARPPFTLEAERALLQAHGIDVMVCKNSGGDATSAKLAAARTLGLPVIMIRRPNKPAGPSAATAEGLRDLVLKLI